MRGQYCYNHSSFSIVHRVESFGQGAGPIYLSRLDCHGGEATLLGCESFTGATGVHDCSHSDDVGVHCEGTVSCSGTSTG